MSKVEAARLNVPYLSPAERATRGKAAARLSGRFGWDQSLDALVTLYQSVHSPRGGGVAA